MQPFKHKVFGHCDDSGDYPRVRPCASRPCGPVVTAARRFPASNAPNFDYLFEGL
jgi:hypothetical protein